MNRSLLLAIIGVGTLIALALYMRPIPDRYVFKSEHGQVQRLDTATGEMLMCYSPDDCTLVDRAGRPRPAAPPEPEPTPTEINGEGPSNDSTLVPIDDPFAANANLVEQVSRTGDRIPTDDEMGQLSRLEAREHRRATLKDLRDIRAGMTIDEAFGQNGIILAENLSN